MRQISLPKTHPYLALIAIDPVDLQRLQRMTEDQPELQFLDFEDDEPDYWKVRIGCSSRAVASALEDAWG